MYKGFWAVPFGQMYQEHTSSLLHRFDHHASSRSHGRVCELHGVEVEHGIQDPVGRTWPTADQDGKAVQGGINKKNITMTMVLWLAVIERPLPMQSLPAVLLQYAQHSVQQTSTFSVKRPSIQRLMVWRDLIQ